MPTASMSAEAAPATNPDARPRPTTSAVIAARARTSWTLWWSILPGANMPVKYSAAPPMLSAGSNAQSPPIARAILNMNASAAAINASGQATSATVSPVAMLPVSAEAASMIAAIGASTSRDQCMTKPPAVPMRYWCRSNQAWPPIRSRTCTSLSRLSLSPCEAASVGKPA